jgi:predicted ArsR family transcriptional regulator
MSETRRIEVPFPDDLEARMNAILSTVNTELKSVTLLHLDDKAINEGDIRKRIRESVGKEQYLPHAVVMGDYCDDTFVPMSLVARQEIIRDQGDIEEIGYSRTIAGKKYAQPLAAYALRWAVENEMSLYTVLRKVSSRGESRAPMNTILILKELEKRSGQSRVSDLVGSTTLEITGVRSHLSLLKNAGFVDYESIGYGETGYVKYRWTDVRKIDEIETVAGQPALTESIAKELANCRLTDAYTLKERIGYHGQISNVAKLLAGLRRQRAVESIRWEGRIRSEVVRTESGTRFITNFIGKLELVLSDERSALRDIEAATDFLSSDKAAKKRYACEAIELYRQVSPNINARPRSETNERIKICVAQNPGITAAEIKKELSVQIRTVQNYLKALVDNGVIRTEEVHKEARLRYFPAT